MKRCSKCEFPKYRATDYHKDAKSKDKLSSRCKPCIKESKAIWRKDNLDKVRISKQQWRQTPNGREYKKISSANRRARHSTDNFCHKLTKTEWAETKVEFNDLCAYCQREVFLEIEHVIPISDKERTSNAKWNIVTACKSCNSGKHDKTLWVDWVPKNPHPELLRRFPPTKDNKFV